MFQSTVGTIVADARRYLGRAAVLASLVWPLALLWYRGLFAVAVYRFGFWIDARLGRPQQRYLRYGFKLLFHPLRKLSMFRAKVEILESTVIGPGLYLSNRGHVIVGARSIGRNCTIGSHVTIGMDTKRHAIPQIGDDVVIGSDCIVFGDIVVGSGSVIEPGTVLTKTVPERSLVRGNPARIVARNIDRAQYQQGVALADERHRYA